MKRIALLTLVGVSIPLAALGEKPPPREVVLEAQRRFGRANEFYNDGRYEEALRLYQAAYDLLPSVDILYNIGLAREKVLDYEGCALSFKQYLDGARDESDREKATKRMETCRSRTMIPTRISSMPPSAAILIGAGSHRKPHGRTPTNIQLAPGSYTITVEMPGYLPQTQEITVEIGSRPEIDFSLEKLSSLNIEADVPGAFVSIDSSGWEASPLRRELAAGLYRVEVRRTGYRTMRREVRVDSGQQFSLMVSLPPLPKVRTLSIESNALAQVMIDGKRVGRSPVDSRLLVGVHRVELQAAAHVPYIADIHVPDDADLWLRVHMEPHRSKAERMVFWSLVGASGVTAISGGVFGILALSDQERYNDLPTKMIHRQGEERAKIADTLWGTALALAATAAVYYFITEPSSSTALIAR
ncbi:MAG: PEGA domain-containing protein [Deltaproteobacteria bacterium]|nr:PEGA domain-containing protein [Deltaproteobacteria bacterium]